jgi:hypothetical protein
MSYVKDVTGHRWSWIFKRWPKVSQGVRWLIDETFGDPAIDWHPMPSTHGGVVFTRQIVDGEWPYDVERVTVSIDALGRLRGCTREKVIHIESGKSYADLRRMLRLPAEQDPEVRKQ